jgi:hypothetical protein
MDRQPKLRCRPIHRRDITDFMARRRGNPNWGKADLMGPVIPTITAFDRVTRELNLQPDQFIRSTQLRLGLRRTSIGCEDGIALGHG